MTYGELATLLPTWARRTLDAGVVTNTIAKANARAAGESYGIDKTLFTGAPADEIPVDFGVLLEGAMVEVRRWEDDPESAEIHAQNYTLAMAAWQKSWDQENLCAGPLVAPQMVRG